MMDFLLYDGKVALALLVFYLFYRFLLKKETFHRFNRVVLVGTAVLSFLLPLCIITIHKPIEAAPVVPEPTIVATELPAQELVPLLEPAVPWWPTALTLLFWAGVAFVLAKVTLSILSIVRIIRQGRLVREEDGCKIIVTERDIDPFSWMKYIVLSGKDWEAPHESILAHEKAHIGLGHSLEVLLVDVLSALQWFNPAIWMLRADLQELHEYEADDAVLRAGTNIKEYQYLLIRKAVSKSGYSVANSFNHSILKNRITMMSKSKSPLSRGLRVLYLIPLTCIGLGMQARTIYVAPDKDNEKILSERLSGTARTGVFQKNQAVLPEIVVVKYADASVKPEDINHGASLEDLQISDVLEADTAPVCSENFAMWLNTKLFYPQGCLHDGTVLVRFTVNKNGKVSDVNVMNGICEELDNAVVKLIEKSPVWTPATRKGKKVAVQLVQPVIFAIRTK
ncbi:MAG: TonB family protein [Bacteroidales bacterium]|nr:TonB family protein [Bacteroidales bacterium]